MINCFTCYQCKHIGNILYCPFFDIQPCYRGEHKLDLGQLNTKQNVNARKIIVPRSQSMCYKHTERILKAYSNAESMLELAKELNINKDTMRMYADRLLDFNGITVATIRGQEWRLIWR